MAERTFQRFKRPTTAAPDRGTINVNEITGTQTVTSPNGTFGQGGIAVPRRLLHEMEEMELRQGIRRMRIGMVSGS
jgi:hypothetical protein